MKAPRRRRMALWELCVLVAGLAVGFWLFGKEFPLQVFGEPDQSSLNPYGIWIGFLGGLSVVGPPILLWERRRQGRRFGPGQLLWFSQGMSAWLLWPPSVVARAVQGQRPQGGGPMSETCFAYGTPLMALYLGSALIAGGWIRRRGRRRRQRSWTETFGLVLGMLWACTGGYCLSLIYGNMR